MSMEALAKQAPEQSNQPEDTGDAIADAAAAMAAARLEEAGEEAPQPYDAEPPPSQLPQDPESEEPPAAASAEGGGEDGGEDEAQSASWAAIKRAERRNLQRERELKKQRAELEDRIAKLEAGQSDASNFKQKLVENPIEALEGLGISYEDLIQRGLNNGRPSAEEMARRMGKEAKGELAELRDEIKKLREERETAAQQQKYQAEYEKYENQVNEVLGGEGFELLSSYPGAAEEVMQYAILHAQEYNVALTPKEAADKIQTELKNRLSQMKSHKAVRELFGLSEEDVPGTSSSKGDNEAPRPASKPRTITNNLAAAPSGGRASLEEDLSEQALIAQTAELLRGLSG